MARDAARPLSARRGGAGWDARWLIMGDDDDDDDAVDPDAALQAFITGHRAPFQASAYEDVWIEAESDGNSWTVAYTHQGWLHWMSHDQG